MRIITIILVSYLSLLVVSPAACGLYETIKQVDLCCSTNKEAQCSKEQSQNKQQSNSSDNNAPCTPCCSVQNCHCYFVTVPQFDFGIRFIKVTDKIRTKNENVLSNYSSDCWHPPKLV